MSVEDAAGAEFLEDFQGIDIGKTKVDALEMGPEGE
jgi:hypothetical protein